MNAKRGSSSSTEYTVTGKTLVDIDKEIDKKGPKDPNESARYAGSCKGKIDLQIGARDFEFVTTQGSSPLEVTARLKGGSVTSSCVVTLPKLASEKTLSAPALKEWKRFLSATSNHEDGHADSYYALAVTLAGEMVAMASTGTGKDEKTAQVAAQKALIASLAKTYGGTVLDDRVKADAKAYDAKTKHGESQGAKLKTSI
jgi:predicted secreted Zn-dependent protease